MTRLSRRGRVSGIVIIVTGLLSFFEPLIKVKPDVMGRSHWSVFELIDQSHERALRTDTDKIDFWTLLFFFGTPYALMLFALVSLCFFPLQKLLVWTGVIGAVVAAETLRGDTD